MLGRYVAGTLLILGVAMVVAPDAPETTEMEVTRSDAAPMALATANEAPVALIDETPAPQTVALAEPAPITVTAAAEEVVAPPAPEQERVQVSLPAQQIGGIASLAGLEPAPTVIVSRVTSEADSTQAEAVQAETVQVAVERPAFHYVTGSRVNVRSGPSTDFRVIARALRGDPVEILSEDSGWAEIRIVGTDDIGYMSADFLAEDLNG